MLLNTFKTILTVLAFATTCAVMAASDAGHDDSEASCQLLEGPGGGGTGGEDPPCRKV